MDDLIPLVKSYDMQYALSANDAANKAKYVGALSNGRKV